MSVPVFGRVTPLQADMLGIGGVICGVPDDLVQEQDRIKTMKKSREMLRKETGEDFGFDISAWHEFLLNSDAHREEYTFHYAWEAVCPKINELIDDQDRQRLVALAEGNDV